MDIKSTYLYLPMQFLQVTKLLQCSVAENFSNEFSDAPAFEITRNVISLRQVHRLINPIKRGSSITR